MSRAATYDVKQADYPQPRRFVATNKRHAARLALGALYWHTFAVRPIAGEPLTWDVDVRTVGGVIETLRVRRVTVAERRPTNGVDAV